MSAGGERRWWDGWMDRCMKKEQIKKSKNSDTTHEGT